MSNRAYKTQHYPPGLQYGQCHLIVDTEHGAAVLYELTGGQARVVGLSHRMGHGVTGDNRPRGRDPDTKDMSDEIIRWVSLTCHDTPP